MGVGLVALCLLGSSCVAAHQRALYRESRGLAKSVKKGDAEAVSERVLPGARSSVDVERLVSKETSKAWSTALDEPTSVRPEAILMLGPEDPAEVVWTDDGWRFASDPTDFYAQGTPREALRSLVRASRSQRWDRLIDLAPRRYRIGLSPQDLQRAWTEGEHAQELRAARDRLAEHLDDPIRADAHEAVLELGGGRAARLEREGDRWVVVDF
jgi:hypothetical protein